MPSDQFLERFKVRISEINDRELIEKHFYEDLSTCLKYGHFESFRKLFNSSIDFNIFVDVEKIPNRFDIISTLLLSCTDKVSNGYQTSALGEIIAILRFCNEFNLLERKLKETEEEALKDVKKDKLFLANLKDLFGKISNSFIFYVYDAMPRDLYEYFINNPISYFPDRDGLMYYIKNIFFDQYTIYGLSVRYLSSIEQFLNTFEKNSLFYKQQKDNHKVNSSIKDKEFMEFDIVYKYRTYYYDTDEEHEYREIKKHLVSPENILKNLDNILAKENYNFYNLSMVVLGGLGPQGLGFTYSTPKGEVIEICSDQKESEAIIIKFKQYLKRKFLRELEKKLASIGIKVEIRVKINNYLTEIFNPKELISYNDRVSTLRKIKSYLNDEFQQKYTTELNEIISKISEVFYIIHRKRIKIWYKLFFKRKFFRKLEKEMTNLSIKFDIRKRVNELLTEILNPKDFFNNYDNNSILKEIRNFLSYEFQQRLQSELNEINRKISKAFLIILREIKLKDQFKTRMDLVTKDKIKSEDIAKLTSLKGKSHYDVLRERFFFQYIVDWFYDLYNNEKLKPENKNK